MPYDPRRHHRHSIRLKGYDYSLSGAYFITVRVHHANAYWAKFTTLQCGSRPTGLLSPHPGKAFWTTIHS